MNEIDFLINNYQPFDELEKEHLDELRNFVKSSKDIYKRSFNGEPNITASCIVVNEDFSKVLVMHHIFHNFYKQFGGHLEGNSNLAEVAKQELEEEAGVKGKLLSERPLDFVLWNCPERIKGDIKIPPHKIYDVAFLFQIDEKQKTQVAIGEGFDIKWIDINQWRDMEFDPKSPVIKNNPHNSHYNKRIFNKVSMIKGLLEKQKERE